MYNNLVQINSNSISITYKYFLLNTSIPLPLMLLFSQLHLWTLRVLQYRLTFSALYSCLSNHIRKSRVANEKYTYWLIFIYVVIMQCSFFFLFFFMALSYYVVSFQLTLECSFGVSCREGLLVMKSQFLFIW